MSHGLFYRCLCYVSGSIAVALLSIQGLRALRFDQKYLHLCSEDERRSYGFEKTRGWVINDRIFILGWTIPLNRNFGAGSQIFWFISERRSWFVKRFANWKIRNRWALRSTRKIRNTPLECGSRFIWFRSELQSGIANLLIQIRTSECVSRIIWFRSGLRSAYPLSFSPSLASLYLFEQWLRLGVTSTSSVWLPLQDESLYVFPNCKSLWIKASAKWLNVNVNVSWIIWFRSGLRSAYRESLQFY